jgi:PII-like signaling protein
VTEPGIKLTTYFEERDRSGDAFLADALFDVYERHRMRTSVLLRGIAGFGQRHGLHTERLLTLSEDLPAVSIAVDTHERIERMLPDVIAATRHGLISLERAQLTASGLGSIRLPREPGAAVKLTVYGGRSVRAGGGAAYVAAVDALRRAGADGASVLLAVDGVLHGERRRARFFGRNADVPLMLLAIGGAEPLEQALPALAEFLDDPVATVERVEICKLEGAFLRSPSTPPERDASGLPIHQKLMIHCEEQARHAGQPLHLALLTRLLEAGAAGATVLRGVRGFYGGHEPFADRFMALRRNPPVHVVVVDAPERMQRWWPIVDEVTAESGLVTAELVPASHAFSGTDGDASLMLADTTESGRDGGADQDP